MTSFVFAEEETLLEAGQQESDSVSEWKWSQVLQGRRPGEPRIYFQLLGQTKQRREEKSWRESGSYRNTAWTS